MKIMYIVFMVLGCFLGAGFVSGKEIATYFSVFGEKSYLGIIILTIVMFILLVFFLTLSNNSRGLLGFTYKYFGGAGNFLNFLFFLVMLIFVGSMLSGICSLCKYYSINAFFLVVPTLAIVCYSIISNGNAMGKLNAMLVPFIVVVVLYLVMNISSSNIVEGGDSLGAILSSVNYGLINIVPLGLFILEVGEKVVYSKKDILFISSVATIIISFLLLFYNRAILACNLQGESMPLIMLASGKGVVIRWVVFVSLYAGMATTLVSCSYVVNNYIYKKVRSRKHSTMLTLLFGFIISFLGFDKIVNYLYSIVGVVGAYIIIRVLIKESRNLKNQVSKN